ncbi:MAG: MFS transporter [Saccharospirillum sp.]
MAQTPPTTARVSALSEPVFRTYFYATSSATLAVWIARFLIGWTAWDLTQSAFWVGVASAMLLAPTFLLSPVFGVISDRIDPRNGVLATASLNTLICLMLALLAFMDWIALGPLMLGALAFGCVTAAHHPMRLALVPKLLSRHLLPSGIGLTAIVFNLSRIIGPAIGAAIINLSAIGFAFALSAVMFVVTWAFLLRVPTTPIAAKDRQNSLLRDLHEGFRFIRRSPLIRLILLMTLVNGLVGRSLMELLPAVSGQLAGGTADALATLTAVAGGGAIVGGWVVSRQKGDPVNLSHLVFAALLTGAAILMPVIWAGGLASLIPIIAIASGCMTIIGTGCQALVQLVVEDAFRGRVMSIWTVVSMGSPALGAFLMGALADRLGFGWTLIAAGGLAISVTLMLARKRERFRWVR